MPERNWSNGVPIVGSLIAIGLIAWGLWAMIYSMGYSEGRHYADARGYAAEYPADTERRIKACPTDTQAALKACVEEAVAAAHDAQRSEQDLNAQRDMAKWAWWLLIVSSATLFVSGFGLLALIVTIRQGQRGLERAREANEIAEAAQRPWIVIHPRIDDCFFDGNLCGVTVSVEFKNIGQSVAASYHSIAAVFFVGKSERNAIDKFLERHPPFKFWPGVLIPGDTDEKLIKKNFRVDDIPWFGAPDEHAALVVVAAAYYRLRGKERSDQILDQLQTMATYYVGLNIRDHVRRRSFYKADLGAMTSEQFVFTKILPSRAR